MTDPASALWDRFVADHPQGTIFHHSAWPGIVADVFQHRAHPLTVTGPGGELRAVLPLVEVKSRLFGHALISNAFCVGGGPLALDEASLAEILDQAETLGRQLGVDYIELRDVADAPQTWLARDGLYATFAGPIEADEEANLLQIPRKQRAVVRKAMARGFEISIDKNADTFFPLYARTMRDHGTPALPKRFFEALLSRFGDRCEILTVRQAGTPISSVLSYYHGTAVQPYYTGSRLEARASGANDMMYWALMRRAVERGYATFDFGRSKVDTGPYNFKRNWGFEPRSVSHRYRMINQAELPNLNPTNPRYAAFIKAWRRLPLPVATAVSPFLSRSLA